MALEWTHDAKSCAEVPCTGDTECAGFPTAVDRVDMARAAFNEYTEGDGTPADEFFMDVALFLFSEAGQRDPEQTTLKLYHLVDLVDRAEIEWREQGARIAAHWRKS